MATVRISQTLARLVERGVGTSDGGLSGLDVAVDSTVGQVRRALSAALLAFEARRRERQGSCYIVRPAQTAVLCAFSNTGASLTLLDDTVTISEYLVEPESWIGYNTIATVAPSAPAPAAAGFNALSPPALVPAPLVCPTYVAAAGGAALPDPGPAAVAPGPKARTRAAVPAKRARDSFAVGDFVATRGKDSAGRPFTRVGHVRALVCDSAMLLYYDLVPDSRRSYACEAAAAPRAEPISGLQYIAPDTVKRVNDHTIDVALNLRSLMSTRRGIDD